MFEDSNLRVSLWIGGKTQRDHSGEYKREYRCTVYPLDPNIPNLDIPDLPSLPGIYIFSKALSSSNRYPSLYIGQTKNLEDRFDSHCQLDCIRRKQAACLHIYATGFEQKPALDLTSKKVREEIECDLQSNYQVFCPDWEWLGPWGNGLLVGGVPAPPLQAPS